ncbi:MAG TPA: hypothetical protein VFA90_04325 [Terriglobales bacterium]|nr:hypothetical protein [Terriglobales bacterium]
MTENEQASGLLMIRPGYGADNLHLGQTESEIVIALGQPESRTRKYKGEYYYNYPGLGFEFDFGQRGGLVRYIFCFREGFRRNRQARVVTDRGIKPGDSKEAVLKLMGRPDAQGKATTLHFGDRLAAWFRYNDGINFQFDDDGRIEMITIAAPRQQANSVLVI